MSDYIPNAETQEFLQKFTVQELEQQGKNPLLDTEVFSAHR